ncbi:hypothetical protein AAFF_G00128140 [Aldrovandia affinis]|uniref:Uncharacterized protein n=1 Tax=Aldrovandia affinis TaxID=143900 RepID=A0AAD7T157_9TELE|nr:hypothetical protein AAFF_G00128140 [Aldrovandia affinis]
MESETTAMLEGRRPPVAAMPTATISVQDSPEGAGDDADSCESGSQSGHRNGLCLSEPQGLTACVQTQEMELDTGVVYAQEWSGKVRLLACSDDLDRVTAPVAGPGESLGQASDPARPMDGSVGVQSECQNEESNLTPMPSALWVGQMGPGGESNPLGVSTTMGVLHEHYCVTGSQTDDEELSAFTYPALPGPGGAMPGSHGVDGAGAVMALWELPRIVRHKPSSITFSDCDCPSSCPSSAGSALFISESSDGGESSSGDEEGEDGDEDNEDDNDDNDDVFTELPQYREFLISRRRRSANRGRPKRNGLMKRQDVPHEDAPISPDTASSHEAEEEIRGKDESLQVVSPWSDSMIQLMKKLDQLNMDIEEALSAGSSPSDTPSLTRKQMLNLQQCSSLSQPAAVPGAAVEPVQGEDGTRARSGTGGCRSQNSSLSSSSSCLRRNGRVSGTRPRKTKGTVKMSQGGAGKAALRDDKAASISEILYCNAAVQPIKP